MEDYVLKFLKPLVESINFLSSRPHHEEVIARYYAGRFA